VLDCTTLLRRNGHASRAQDHRSGDALDTTSVRNAGLRRPLDDPFSAWGGVSATDGNDERPSRRGDRPEGNTWLESIHGGRGE
jgi:hypothetical protein